MAISFLDGKTDHLAREVARMSGETLTEAIGIALRGRLERVNAQRDLGRAAWRSTIGDRCVAHIGAPVSSTAHGELLYDQVGPPR